MIRSADGDGHVRLELGLYVLGKLEPSERDAVRRHIVQCAVCRLECQQLNAVVELLVAFSDEDWQSVVDDGRSSVVNTVAPGHLPAAAPASEPARRHRSWRGVSTRVRLSVSAAMLILVAGISIGVWSRSGTDPQVDVPVAATDPVTGATLSVTVNPRGTATEVRAVVGGLEAGLQFDLVAVSTDGTAQIVHQGTATGGQLEIVVTVNVSVADLAFFTVTRADGSVLVTVHVTHTAR